VTNGTSCGTNRVCDNGNCNTCVANQACLPVTKCRTGETSCASGASQCLITGTAPNGTSCGTGMTCDNGSCL
jgi:hypothetical protein